MPSLADVAADLLRYALAFPEAWEDHPWGENVVKVRKKVFVFFGVPAQGRFGMSVKLPFSMMEALEEEWTEPTGYGLGKAGWVSAGFVEGDEVPVERMKEWIEESYRAVAPKTLVKRLDAD